MVKVKEDLTGKTFNRLTVLCQDEDYVQPNGRHIDMWVCQCDCEDKNIVSVRGISLKNGNTKSCGCMQIEAAIKTCKNQKQYNQYEIYDDYVIGFIHNTNEKFYFDLEDYDKIKDYCWHKDSSGYAAATIDNKTVRMHKLLGFSNYDHKDRSKLNNKKNNLRLAEYSQNAQNHGKRIDNTSGVIGVYFNKFRNKWFAMISSDVGKSTRVYYGDSKEEAIIARLKAEQKYYGDFAPQQHLYEEYGIL